MEIDKHPYKSDGSPESWLLTSDQHPAPCSPAFPVPTGSSYWVSPTTARGWGQVMYSLQASDQGIEWGGRWVGMTRRMEGVQKETTGPHATVICGND